jgi:hypothetical protein
VLRGHRAQPDHREHKALLALRVRRVRLVLRDRKGYKVPPVRLAHKERKALRAQLVPLARRACRGRKV